MRALIYLLLPCAAASGQCGNSAWSPIGGPISGGGYARVSMMWDPDGAGPITPKLIVGGMFFKAGNVLANNIASYDPATGVWSALGAGVSGIPDFTEVSALTTASNGDLIVGGDFISPGGDITKRGVARWTGASWSAIGAGMDGAVQALATLSNGEIVAGGQFANSGTTAVSNIARWNGASWVPMAGGMNGKVYALAIYNGALIAAGDFTVAGGASANSIARWDSVASAWVSLGTGLTGPYRTAYALAVRNGELIAGGSFSIAGGLASSGVASWNGSTWTSMNPVGIDNAVRALAVTPSGELFAGGQFTFLGGFANRIARWNGSAWANLGLGAGDSVFAITVLPSGELAVSGNFVDAGGFPANHIARYSTIGWATAGQGLSGGGVFATTVLPNGNLIVGGDFRTAGGVSAANIAQWNGSTWSALGSGMAGSNEPFVQALTSRPNGDIIAAGWFDTAGGAPIHNGLVRWNGQTWTDLSAGFDDNPSALITLPNGEVVAVGSFTTAGGIPANGVARWDGVNWFPYGTGISNAFLLGLTHMPNGDIVVGGVNFPALTAAAYRWNGATWINLSTGFKPGSFIAALAALPNGDLIAGGEFTTAGGVAASRIARWNGSSWSALGAGTNGVVTSLATLSSGDVAVGGSFATAGGAPALNVARWNPSGWSSLASGTNGMIRTLTARPNAELIAGGQFNNAGEQPIPALAKWSCCYVNCDGSTSSPILTANDFQCFLNKFAAQDAYANCDGSTSPPILNANDFQCFLNQFAAGCS